MAENPSGGSRASTYTSNRQRTMSEHSWWYDALGTSQAQAQPESSSVEWNLPEHPNISVNPEKQQEESVKKVLRGGVDPEVGAPYRIKPGEVRNPLGINGKRPWLTEVTEEMLEEKLGNEEYRKAYKESLWNNLMSGRVVGAMTRDSVWERTEGKVAQPVRVSGELTVSLADEVRKARERAEGE